MNQIFEKAVHDLKHWLLKRGYRDDLINTQIDKARGFTREALLSEKIQKAGENRVFLVLTYHPAFGKKIYDVLKQNHNILNINEEHKRIFNEIPLVSFRRGKTLKDVLVRSKLKEEFKPGGCVGCGRRNCLVDTFLDTTGVFKNSKGDRTYNIRKGTLNCNSKYVVYLLTCKTCNKQYVGSCVTKFRTRFNNYKSQFKKYLQRKTAGDRDPGRDIKQAGLFEHFCGSEHSGVEDWSFTIIDQADTLSRVRKRESFWQHKLDTFVPNGLNERQVSF